MDDTEDLVIVLFSVGREKGDRERAGGDFTVVGGNHADALHRVVGQIGHRQTGFRVVGGIGIKLNFHPFDILAGCFQGEVGGLGHAVPFAGHLDRLCRAQPIYFGAVPLVGIALHAGQLAGQPVRLGKSQGVGKTFHQTVGGFEGSRGLLCRIKRNLLHDRVLFRGCCGCCRLCTSGCNRCNDQRDAQNNGGTVHTRSAPFVEFYLVLRRTVVGKSSENQKSFLFFVEPSKNHAKTCFALNTLTTYRPCMTAYRAGLAR